MASRKRVIIDTNLWSYVGDFGQADALRHVIEQTGFTILLPPSILMELLRNPHAESRRRHVAAIGAVRGQRMSSEAELCANDFIRMVKRCRPEWLRAIADMSSVDKFHRLWTRDVWRFAKDDPDAAHEMATEGYDPTAEITTIQKHNRKQMLTDNFASDYIGLLRAGSPEAAQAHLPGWDGHKVEAWRFDLASRYWFDMTTGRGTPGYNGLVQTNRDWIGSRVNMRQATSDSIGFVRLWFDEAQVDEVPRDWIRAALAYTQTTMKIGPGNARDEQHSAYLPDADTFLTADRRFATALHEVRRQAPFDFAEPHVVSASDGGSSLVDEIASILVRAR